MTNDIRDMLLNREVIAIDQDPLGIQGRKVQKRGTVEVWSKPLADGEVAIALFNRGTSSTDTKFKWSDLGFPNGLRVRDLWKQMNVDRAAAEYSTTIPPHGSVLLRITRL
jgi:alpha-galactosidase